MLNTTTSEIAKILDLHNVNYIKVNGVSTDSRNIEKGNLFVPLKGENFNGHDYIVSSLEKGATVSLCEIEEFHKRRAELEKHKGSLLLVDDAKKAYFHIMAYWRRQFPNLISFGIGGTTGKTTTKELLRAICEASAPTVYTKENLNTSLGMCMITNELEEKTKFMVCEMGTDTFGEITEEALISQPNIGVCLSVGPTHAELLGGTIDGVAKAESEMVKYFRDKGTVFLNKDDNYVWNMRKIVDGGKIVTFGKNDGDIFVENYKMDTKGMTIDLNILKGIFVPTYGEGNIYNVMAAVGMAKEAGILDEDIIHGIRNYKPVKGRLNFFRIHENVTIQDDAYNANPQSMRQSIDVFNKLCGNACKIYFLGDMRELGEHAQDAHRELLELIKENKPDMLIYAGDFSDFIGENLKEDIEDITLMPNIKSDEEISRALEILNNKLVKDSWVLMKGSKGTGVWKVVEKLREKK